MKVEKTLCEALCRIAGMNTQNCLSEEIVFQYTEKEGLSLAEISRVCRQLEVAGVKIVSQAEYDAATPSAQQNTPARATVEGIVKTLRELSVEEQKSCLSKLQRIVHIENEKRASEIRHEFIDRIERMPTQYSYMSVLLIAFINTCGLDGKAPLSNVVDQFSRFYRSRHERGEIAEQADSVLASPDFTQANVRTIILKNPLKRSFLSNYMTYIEEEQCIQMSEVLWSALSGDDLKRIKATVESKLDGYYTKIRTNN